MAAGKENVAPVAVASSAQEGKDKMEELVQKTIDLMETLMKSDADPEKVRFAAKALDSERKLIMEWDTNREDPLRDLMYDFTKCIEYAMVWYVDREEKLMKEVKKEEPVDDEEGSDLFAVSDVASTVKAKGKAAKGKDQKKVKEEPKEPKAATRKRVAVKEEVNSDEDEGDKAPKSPEDKKPDISRKRVAVKEEVQSGDEEAPKSPQKKKPAAKAPAAKKDAKKAPVKATGKGSLDFYMRKK